MASIEILEKFQVHAAPAVVWQYLLDPAQVMTCLPGAQLDEVIDARTFNGSMKVKVGPIVTNYRGRVTMTTVDEAAYVVVMTGEGREGSGGSVRGSMTSRLLALDGGGTEVTVESHAEITGRIAQFGRGLIQEVSTQLFQQFVACSTQRLDAMAAGPMPPPPPPPPDSAVVPAAAATAPAAGAPAEAPPNPPPPASQSTMVRPATPPPAKPVSLLPVVAKSIWSMLARLVATPFRRKR